MFVIDVIPINKGVFSDKLSYFSSAEVADGSLVRVQLRGKLTEGLVVGHTAVADVKSQLKSEGFALKKISKIVSAQFLSPVFLQAALEINDFYAGNLGQTLSHLLPSAVLEAGGPFSFITSKKYDTKSEILYAQDSDSERLSYYRRIIREEFARKKSVFLISPTQAEAENAFEIIKRGIDRHAYLLHGKMAPKKFLPCWKEIVVAENQLVVVGTPIIISLLSDKISTVILDRECSSSYKTLSRPYVDMRKFVETVCKIAHIRCMFGDISLRTETLYRASLGELTPALPPKYRLISKTDAMVVDMRKEEKETLRKKDKGRAIGFILKENIKKTLANKGNAVLIAGRRGLSPSTICGDCGETVSCRRCLLPFVLHKTHGKYVFSCHHCGFSEEATDDCPNCGSWKLIMLGIGVEKAEQELASLFPKTPIFKINSDETASIKEARETAQKFYASPGAILIGTEMALPYLTEPVELVAVVSVDTLFVIPDFRISEHIFNLLVRLREKSGERFIVQTRNADSPLLQLAVKANLIDFFREELNDRKNLSYPPFSLFIKISRGGRKDEVNEKMKGLSKRLKDYNPEFYASFGESAKESHILNMLLKIDPKKWPEKTLLSILRSLSPAFLVDIDPVTIL